MPAKHCTWSATEAGAAPGAGRCLLFLDFDGVVCDSERECFVSSWLTYRELSAGAEEPGVARDPERIPLRARRRFRELRPLIRSGEDYVVIQRILAHEELQPAYRGPATQHAFDAYRHTLGALRIAAYQRAMAATRGSFLKRDKNGWLALNRIYPHMRELLTRCDLANVRILSTKAAPLVCEILRAHEIPLPDAAVFHAASNPDGTDTRKLDMIAAQLDAVPGGRALFVEDQLDHLLGNHDRRIAAYLADWGYVLPQWLAQADHLRRNGVEILGGTQMAELFCRVAPVPG
jgi:hypothetical protein